MNVGPDWTAVPSYLQDQLNQRSTGRPIRVYNFGCGSYFSTQERILFQQLLLAKAVPDVAIFFDGINDFYFFDGRPSIWGFFKQALDRHNRESYETTWNRLAAKPKWQKLHEFLTSLPINRTIDVLGLWLAKRNATAEEVLYRPISVDAGALMQSMDRYLENKRQIEAIAKNYGVRTLFIWQPSPAYKYDLKNHLTLNRHYGLGGHERSGVGYALMAKRLETYPTDDNFIWLADIQEKETQPIYLDNVHYTSKFSEIISGHIAKAVIKCGCIPQVAASSNTDRD